MGHDSTVESACVTAFCGVRIASTTRITCPMRVASTRDSVDGKSGGASKMTMRSG